ncbi:MAG: hypothetical protein JO129_03665 [Candidatus Dependentiae bacterium]|nr:hypothetical protein [Candidatus Dependentiae bacterium]
MKKLQILALAMLFAMTGIDTIQATKGCESKTQDNCHGGCEWRKNKCRSKAKKVKTSKSSSKSNAIINNDDSTSSPIMGGNPSTYAPQVFEPADQFNGDGLVGNYFSNSQTATIHDPSGINPTNYTFSNVQAISQAIRAQGTLIGTFSNPNWQPSTTPLAGGQGQTVRLYGNLISNN